jgi:hypothetical protein
MTPLPTNPTVIALVDDNNQVVGVATNVAPLNDMIVIVTNNQNQFNELSKGKTFITGADEVK